MSASALTWVGKSTVCAAAVASDKAACGPGVEEGCENEGKIERERECACESDGERYEYDRALVQTSKVDQSKDLAAGPKATFAPSGRSCRW